MRKFITNLLTALVFASLVIFIACGKKGGSGKDDPRDDVGSALTATWYPTSVTLGSENREEWMDAGFALTVTYNTETDKGSYVVSNVPDYTGADDVWGDNMTWTFDGDDESADTGTIVRADGIIMSATLDNVDNPTQLTISFEITDAAARTAGFNGEWTFVFDLTE